MYRIISIDLKYYRIRYVALTVGIGTPIVWLSLGEPMQFAIERMVTVMVIACPHALGLAVPLVVAVGTSLSAGSGLLIRDRAAFERARNLNAVVFDKTGTLTEGRFGVSDIVMLAEGSSEDNELRFAASVESQSKHPIAHGIGTAAKERGIEFPRPSGVRNVTGAGIVATVESQDVRIMNWELVCDCFCFKFLKETNRCACVPGVLTKALNMLGASSGVFGNLQG